MVILGGCQGAAPPAAPPPRPPNIAAGGDVLDALQYCSVEADRQCGANTIRCDSYRHSYKRTCMVGLGVSPEHILVLVP